MPSLSGQFDPRIGTIINVGFALPIPSRSVDVGAQKPQTCAAVALIDTGATLSCISAEIVDAIGAEPIGIRPMASATHSVLRNVYLVKVVLPFGSGGGAVAPNVQVMEFTPAANSPFQALIGRDVLSKGVFTMTFDGRFTFSI